MRRSENSFLCTLLPCRHSISGQVDQQSFLFFIFFFVFFDFVTIVEMFLAAIATIAWYLFWFWFCSFTCAWLFVCIPLNYIVRRRNKKETGSCWIFQTDSRMKCTRTMLLPCYLLPLAIAKLKQILHHAFACNLSKRKIKQFSAIWQM